jgi:hypothetical protein
MHDFRDHRQRLHTAGADARRQQQFRKILRALFGRGGKGRMQAAGEHVAGAYVVMGGHDEVGKLGLCRGPIRERGIFARDAVGPKRAQQIELGAARTFRAMVGKIDDVRPGTTRRSRCAAHRQNF